jgi:non-canonical poly(A) RNA polymerase PAPD5/7
LGPLHSDIDLVVSSPAIQKSGDIKSTLYRLAYILRRSNITDNVEVLAKTKVPIIKFVTSHGRFPVDISINQLNGAGAVHIINNFLGVLPALRPLVLIVKSFLSQRSMNEVFTGGLGSYSVVCLITSFLQVCRPSSSHFPIG